VYLASGERGTTSISNLPSIGRVNKPLEVGVFQILAKARPLFLQFATTNR